MQDETVSFNASVACVDLLHGTANIMLDGELLSARVAEGVIPFEGDKVRVTAEPVRHLFMRDPTFKITGVVSPASKFAPGVH